MSDSLSHLKKMKRRQTMAQSKSSSNLSPADKVDMLERTLSVFRKEVEMKLTIMQQILTTRNEQVRVQKQLLEREQTLYDTLLGHWKNTPKKLAATGLSVNFTSADILEGPEDAENQSNSYYSAAAGPSPKKSKSSLRRQRSSAKTTPKQRANVGATGAEILNENPEDNTAVVDSMGMGMSNSDWEDEPRNPPVHVELKTEKEVGDEDDFEEYKVEFADEDADSDANHAAASTESQSGANANPRKSMKPTKLLDPVWDGFECSQKHLHTRKLINAKCKSCGLVFKWPKVERLRIHVKQCKSVQRRS